MMAKTGLWRCGLSHYLIWVEGGYTVTKREGIQNFCVLVNINRKMNCQEAQP